MVVNQAVLVEQTIPTLRSILLEALQAGMFLAEDATWRPHHSGEILYFADRVFGIERPAVLVLAPEITREIITDSVESDFRSYVVVGGWLSDGVDLGRGYATRVSRMSSAGENYWATFVLDDAVLVTAGTPLSWCRLVGEVLNAQMSSPFVQRRICHRCHALNDYFTTVCGSCGHTLTLTGRLT
jgi:ribosomal protein L40E